MSDQKDNPERGDCAKCGYGHLVNFRGGGPVQPCVNCMHRPNPDSSEDLWTPKSFPVHEHIRAKREDLAGWQSLFRKDLESTKDLVDRREKALAESIAQVIIDKDGPPIRLQIDLEGQDPLKVDCADEKSACHFIYHGLFDVQSPFVQIINLGTGAVLRGPIGRTVERARTLQMFEDFVEAKP